MMNWIKFEKMWRDRGEVSTRDLVLMIHSCGNVDTDPYKITELIYDRIGIKYILKRRVNGRDVFSINENYTDITKWLSFEKEVAGRSLSGANIVRIANSFGIHETFPAIYKRYSSRIKRCHDGGIAMFIICKGIDNQDVLNGIISVDELKGL